MERIGFIGTGTIGAPMAQRLLDGDHALRVYDRDTAATAELEAAGAIRASGIADVAGACDVVFLSLPGPAQIREVMLGEDGLLAHARDGAIVVDLSTNALALNREIAEAAAARGVSYLDAPVSGGRAGAEAGTLAVMVGGDATAFATIEPLLACFGKNIVHLGDSGNGTLAKLVNNQIFLAASVLIQEGMVMGAKAGLEPATLLEVLKSGSAASVIGAAPLLLSRRFDQGIFALDIAAKDLEVALESATAIGVETPLTAAAADVYRRARDAGLGSEDFYATLKTLEQSAGITLPPLKRRKPAD